MSVIMNALSGITTAVVLATGATLWGVNGTITRIDTTVQGHTEQFKQMQNDRDQHLADRITQAQAEATLNAKVDWLTGSLASLTNLVQKLTERIDNDERTNGHQRDGGGR